MRLERLRVVFLVLGLALWSGDRVAIAQSGLSEAKAKPAPVPAADSLDLVGRTEAAVTVRVVPRVSAPIVKICFRDGQEVQQGQLLYELDARPHQIAMELAQAEVDRARAELAIAELEHKRLQPLVAAATVSREEFEKSATQLSVRKAVLKGAEAGSTAARLNLEFTRIVSPITGVVGETEVNVGEVPEAGSTLTTIVNQDPICVWFEMPERQYLQLARQWRREGAAAGADIARVPIQVGLVDEEGFPRQGRLDFIANRIDPETATARFRAVLRNPDHLMVPGLFVRVRFPLKQPAAPSGEPAGTPPKE
jgi:membrane fusion protein, multidrug efflux system